MSSRILLNATNLHSGGVVQVATSVVTEMASLLSEGASGAGLPPGTAVEVMVSEPIHRNLAQGGLDRGVFADYGVRNVFGLRPFDPVLAGAIDRADAVFTLFGPLYSRRRPRRSVVGFAQPWIIYPDNEIYRRLSPLQKLRSRAKYATQAAILRWNSDRIVVEADHVRDRLVERGLFAAGQVDVVPNCVAAIYSRPDLWRPVEMPPRRAGALRIGFLGRDYPHKNLDILPPLRRALREAHGVEADFIVTLTAAEWQARDADFRAGVLNIGPLDIGQCPSFYRELDAVIFPSLLECFSVTPLEAMVMEKPLIASDRAFVRDVCGEFPVYFDPLSPERAARQIADGLGLLQDRARIAAARRHGTEIFTPERRARRYLEIMAQMLRDRPSGG